MTLSPHKEEPPPALKKAKECGPKQRGFQHSAMSKNCTMHDDSVIQINYPPGEAGITGEAV